MYSTIHIIRTYLIKKNCKIKLKFENPKTITIGKNRTFRKLNSLLQKIRKV